MRQPLTRLLKHPTFKHRSIFVVVCTAMDMIAYDRDASYTAIVRELRGIKKHCEGLLAEKLAEALTGERILPPKRKRNHKRKGTASAHRGSAAL
jgi:hypothetical protein